MWDRIKLYWHNVCSLAGSVFFSTAGDEGYPSAHLIDWQETTLWQASLSGGSTLCFYVECPQDVRVDYLIIYGHNFKSAGVSSVVVERGQPAIGDGSFVGDGSVVGNGTGGYVSLHSPVSVPPDGVPLLVEFGATVGRCFRVKVEGQSLGVLRAALLSLGSATPLGYATGGFDPYDERIEASQVVSRRGYLLGIYERYRERRLKLTFDYMDETTYQSIREWWQSHGLKPLFVGWNPSEKPEDVYLVRPDVELSAPFTEGGLYRRVTLGFRGRV